MSLLRLIQRAPGLTPSMAWDFEARTYPDGTPNIDHPKIGGWERADTMLAKVTSPAELQLALHLADSVAYRGGRVKRLVLPYIPGGRQDRLKDEGDLLFTLASVAMEINLRAFDEVVTVDPHSPASIGFINNLKVLPFEVQFKDAWEGYTGVIAPDQGGRDRATNMAYRIRKPVFLASKHRDPVTNRLSGFQVDGLAEGGHYLVSDDICDGGGTFLGLGEKIREQGAFADLYVTHGLFTKGVDDLLGLYTRIVTTDSVTPNIDVAASDRVSISPITERLIAWTR